MLLDKATFIPREVIPIYPHKVGECLFLTLYQQNIIRLFNLCPCDKWKRTVVLICISLMMNGVKHGFIYLRTLFRSFSVNYLLSFAHISIRSWILFMLICGFSLSLKEISPLPVIWITNNFSLACHLYLNFVYVFLKNTDFLKHKNKIEEEFCSFPALPPMVTCLLGLKER